MVLFAFKEGKIEEEFFYEDNQQVNSKARTLVCMTAPITLFLRYPVRKMMGVMLDFFTLQCFFGGLHFWKAMTLIFHPKREGKKGSDRHARMSFQTSKRN
jgi:hypothetical protein